MSQVRLKRLENDYKDVKNTFTDNRYVQFEVLKGDPPNKYRITYRVKGLIPGDPEPKVKKTHQVEIYLPKEYPYMYPICKFKTRHFHPNVYEGNNTVCLGKWTAELPLADLVVWIGRMIQYQNYNIDDPANGAAADWAEENEKKFPIDDKDIGVLKEGFIDFDEHDSPKPQDGTLKIRLV